MTTDEQIEADIKAAAIAERDGQPLLTVEAATQLIAKHLGCSLDEARKMLSFGIRNGELDIYTVNRPLGDI